MNERIVENVLLYVIWYVNGDVKVCVLIVAEQHAWATVTVMVLVVAVALLQFCRLALSVKVWVPA